LSKAALSVARATVYRWFIIQFIALIFGSAFFFFFEGSEFALSILLGGGICILPQLLFARWWFDHFRANAAHRLIKVFYIAELTKLLLTGFLFVFALRFLSINIVGCLIGFIGSQIVFWLAPSVNSLLSENGAGRE
jgi:ATP synthase protein I